MPVAAPNPDNFAIQRAIVLRSADADVVKLLRRAQQDVLMMLRELETRPVGIGRDVRIAQLNLVRRNLSLELGKVWRELGDITEARRAEAAARAIDLEEQMDQFRFAASGVPGGEAIARAIADGERDAVAGGIDRLIARTTGASYRPLSSRVYTSNAGINGALDRMVNSAITRGLSAKEFAKEVRGFINPATPGGVRYAAMRLARTEINNAAHAVAVHQVQDKPWVEGMKWNLSGSHGRPDICNQLAKGGPANDGVYPKGSVPGKPHPQCLCFVTSVSVDEDEFLDNLVAGKYESYISKYRDIKPGQVIRSDLGGFKPPPLKPPPLKPGPPKPVTPPTTKPGSKPPTQAAPPVPGATAAVEQGAAEKLVAQGLKDGRSLGDIAKDLSDQHGLTRGQALDLINKGQKDLAGSTLAVKPVKPTPAKPTVPRPPEYDVVRDLLDKGLDPKQISKYLKDNHGFDQLSSTKLITRVRKDRLAAEKAPVRPLKDRIKALNADDARKIEEELVRQEALAPLSIRQLDSVSVASHADHVAVGMPDALAWYTPSSRSIKLGREIFTPRYTSQTWRHEQRTNWCSRTHGSQDGMQSTLAHEVGHHIDEMIANLSQAERAGLWDDVSSALGVPPPSGIQRHFLDIWLRKNLTVIQNQVSRYAAHSPYELMAEIWQEYSTSGAKARPAIRTIGQKMQLLAEKGAR